MSRFLHKLVAASALAAGTLASAPGNVFAADDPPAKDGAAKESGDRKPEGGLRDEASRPEIGDLFKKLDADGDGKIAGDDVPDDHRRLFDRLVSENDKDKDGKLSLDEFRAGIVADRRRAEEGEAGRGPEGRGPEGRGPEGGPRGPGRGFEPAEIFKRIDRNGDGKLTKDDAPPEGGERFQGLLERADADKDGSVSEDEFRKSFVHREGGPEGGPRNIGSGNDGPRKGDGLESLPGGPRFGGMGFPGSPVLLAIDTNRDGELSADEITAASSELRKLDKDGDGKLSRQEILPRFEGGPMRDGQGREGRPDGQPGSPRGSGEFFKSRDTNGDGKITREEAPEKLKEHFERIDANKDGGIDEFELRQAFAGPGRPDGAGRPEGGPPREGRRSDGERGPDGRPEGEARREAGPERREEIMRASAEKFKAADKNGDGKLSREEVPEQAREHFAKLDRNSDGGIDPDEMREAGRVLGRRDEKPRGEGDRPQEKKPEGESRRDADRKPDAKSGDEPRKPRDGDSVKEDGAKKDEPKREERKKDDAPKKDDDVKKDDAPSK